MADIDSQRIMQMVRDRRDPNRRAELGEHPSPNTQALRGVLVPDRREELAGKKKRRRVKKRKSKRKSYKKRSKSKSKTAKRKRKKKRKNKSRRKKR